MKSYLKHISLSVILLFFIFSPAYSQEKSNNNNVLELKRNAIYGAVGIGILRVTASGYYERIVGNGIETLNAEVFFRAGILGAEGAEHNGKQIAFDTGLLWGYRKNSILELSVGWHPNRNDESDMLPFGGSFAYRYQKPKGNFIFRFGAGYPEALFISLGFAF